MKKTIVWVLALLVVAAGAFWLMNRSDSGAGAPAEEEDEQQSVVVNLSEQNDSGMSGTAMLTETDGGILVELDLVGAPEDLAQPAHIHSGSCAELGGVVYPLDFPVNGMSETSLDVSINDLAAQLPLAINVHKSPEEAGIYVACGDLMI